MAPASNAGKNIETTVLSSIRCSSYDSTVFPALESFDHRTDARDIHAQVVSRTKEPRRLAEDPYSRRRARGEHVARFQCEKPAQVADRVGHAEDHVCRISVLHQLPVEPALDVESSGIRELVRRHK